MLGRKPCDSVFDDKDPLKPHADVDEDGDANRLRTTRRETENDCGMITLQANKPKNIGQ